MIVAIAGAHGKIAMQLTRLLTARGDRVIGLIRNADHAEEVREQGADPVLCDLEHATEDELATAIAGADTAVFAAGAGPGSGAARKNTMDRDGAIKLLRAATAVGAARYLIVSSIGAENPPDDDDVFSVYLRAKAEADDAVRASDREWTVVRPGRLTDDPGTNNIRIQTDPFRGQVSREDVAAVIAVLIGDPRASHRTVYVNGGDQPIERAVDQALKTQTIPMLMLHERSPRDETAREQLAAVLPDAEVTAPDEVGMFDIKLEADDEEQALERIWDAVAASGTDDHIVFLEHSELPEHWQARSGRPDS